MREANPKQTALFIGFIIIVFICFTIRPPVGIIAFSAGGLFVMMQGLFYARHIRKKGEEVRGFIVEYVPDDNGDPVLMVEFETLAKEKITGTPFISSGYYFPGIGEKENHLAEVKVIYNKNKPLDFILPEYRKKNNRAFYILIAGFLLIMGLAIYDLMTGNLF